MLSADGTSTAYRDRCAFWMGEYTPKTTRHLEREKHPLILTGHGLSLRVDKGSLLVRDGNTHYPAERRAWRFFKGSLAIPPSIVVLDGSGHISLDAIDWLAVQRVPLIRLQWNGQFSAAISSGAQAASMEKVRWQDKTRNDPKARIDFALKMLRQKANNTVETLERYVPQSAIWVKAYENVQRQREAILKAHKPKALLSVLGAEGVLGKQYFRAWTGIELKWSSSKRSAIPEDWRKFTSRSAHRITQARNCAATHPVNAMLNYAYGVLSSQTQIRLVSDGYDPTIGIVHSDAWKERWGYSAGLVLDFIEPMRPVVDRGILKLIQSTTFSGADFSIQNDGTCRLNPELARRVTQISLEYCGVGAG